MIEIRNAREFDSELILWTLLTAIGIEDGNWKWAEKFTLEEDFLYSASRSRIITVDGIPAGCLISYPGEQYEGLRLSTWKRLFGETPMDAKRFESETYPGEYYLDSLAVKPEYRGHDLGRLLLMDGIQKGQALGYENITLIAEVESEALLNYYRGVGFRETGKMAFFGHDYYRMTYRPNYSIRPSSPSDLPIMQEIFAEGKRKMRASGNMLQWEDGYPSDEVLLNDMNRGFSYIVERDGKPVATFVLAICPDPTYATIYNGQWLDDVHAYGTIHRIASMDGYHGIFRSVLDWSFAKVTSIRVDTHRDNLPMQKNLLKNGFTYCGVILLENGDERLAYQRVF